MTGYASNSRRAGRAALAAAFVALAVGGGLEPVRAQDGREPLQLLPDFLTGGDSPPAREPVSPSTAAPVEPTAGGAVPEAGTSPAATLERPANSPLLRRSTVPKVTPTGQQEPPSAAAQPTADAAEGERSVSGVEVDSLSEPSLAGIGILRDGTGGLGTDLYDYTEAAQIVPRLEALPKLPASSVLRQVSRRFLLTEAPPPAGAEKGRTGRDFLDARLRALLALGRVDDLARLIGALPRGEDDDFRTRLRADVALLQGDIDEACFTAPPESSDVFWRQLEIVCDLKAGDQDRAFFALSLLEETGEAPPGFGALVANYLSTEPETPARLSPTPLSIALLSEVGAQPPASFAQSADLPGKVAIASRRSFVPSVRAEAGERATELDAFPVRELRAIFSQVELPEDESPPAEQPAASEPPWLQTVRYFQELALADPADERAAILTRALANARYRNRLEPVGRILLPDLKVLDRNPTFSPLAPDAIRVLLLDGRLDLAQPWLRLTTLPGLEILAEFAGGRPAQGEIMPAMLDPDRLPNLVGPSEALLRLYALRNGLRAELPPDPGRVVAAEPLSGGGTRAVPRGKAEVVLAILEDAGEKPPALLEPQVLELIVLRLRRLGMTREARIFAIEAAVALGL